MPNLSTYLPDELYSTLRVLGASSGRKPGKLMTELVSEVLTASEVLQDTTGSHSAAQVLEALAARANGEDTTHAIALTLGVPPVRVFLILLRLLPTGQVALSKETGPSFRHYTWKIAQ